MDTLYRAIGSLLWHIYLKIVGILPTALPPELYTDRTGLLCTIDDTGKVIIFGARHD